MIKSNVALPSNFIVLRNFICVYRTAFNHKVTNPLFYITDLTPGGGVPFKTWLKVTGHRCLGPGGHGSAVERSKGSLVPQVKALNLPQFNAAFTILGAL